MKIEFLDIILLILFSQLIALTPFLFFSKGSKQTSKKILGLLLFSKAMCITNFICLRLGNFSIENLPHLFFIGSSFTLLWGPTIYLYVVSITKNNFRFSLHDYLHFLPAFFHFIYVGFIFHFNSTAAKQQLLLSKNIFSKDAILIYNIFLYSSIFIYLIYSFKNVFSYRQEIKKNHSSVEKIKLSWLNFILIGFSIKLMADVWYVFSISDSFMSPDFPLYLSRIVLFIFTNYLIYKGFQQQNIFAGFDELKSDKKLSLSKAVMGQYKEKLLLYINEYKPYLNPDLTLQDLSKNVGLPVRSLSEVINVGLGKNFYDFINEFRVKESEKLLAEQRSDFKTILEVIFESGFNSKSSFHKAFKKHNGITPTEFKRLKSA